MLQKYDKKPVKASNYDLDNKNNALAWKIARQAAIWSPVVALIIWLFLVFNPSTYDFATGNFRTAREYTIVEMTTAFAFLAAALIATQTAIRHIKFGGKVQSIAFFIFAAIAFVMAMEETQWGQPILGYQIPGWMAEVNEQNEFTFHNVGAAQGRAEIFYFAFILAVAALYLPRVPGIPPRAWMDFRPRRALLPLLGCITFTALLKAVDPVLIPAAAPAGAVRWTTEITELYIAIWSVAYAFDRRHSTA
ncbi:hypothetical protein AADZ90_006025 [Aestuariibius sp. 2305UL40-4]|uniref:hypothetical protein n=1 Tax=Aestuariibius violaceus TaxID=3234132 RepID=UPI00345E56EF